MGVKDDGEHGTAWLSTCTRVGGLEEMLCP